MGGLPVMGLTILGNFSCFPGTAEGLGVGDDVPRRAESAWTGAGAGACFVCNNGNTPK
jgi:hypothetical protein